MLGFDRAGLKGTSLTTLTDDEVDQIHGGACRILDQTGIAIFDAGILAILDKAGCRIDHESQRANFPERLVEETLSTAPPEFTLFNRLGQAAITLGSENSFVSADHTLRHFRTELLIPDLISHEPRDTWKGGGSLNLPDLTREKATHLLATHQATPLAEGVLAQLDEITLEAQRSS